jgi:hypothetical protein
MAKQVKTTTTPSAWVVNSKDRGRKSIKKGKVYLQDKEEFVIELFNPLQDCVLADIKLNGKSISQTGLVLNPGQRFYLDCFIDDKKKFIFNTYEVEDTTEVANAIAKNGLLEVFFYKESVVTLENWNNKFNRILTGRTYPYWVYPAYPWGTTNPYTIYGNGITTGNSFNTSTLGSGLVTTTANTSNVYCSNGAVDLTNLKSTNNAYYSSNCIPINNSFTQTSFSSEKSLSIETGRVEKGSKSKQKFETVDMDFDNYYIASTIVQLLPDSRKPVETKDLMKHSEYVNQQHDVFDLLQKLSDLHKQNVLTDEEFKEKKDEILSKI